MKNIKKKKKLVDPYVVRDGSGFKLKRYDPADVAGLESESREEAAEVLQSGVKRLGELQELLYAQDRWSVLLIFQAMDAAGKDSTIKHVMSGINPQGCQVFSFKTPSTEELDHDFLWRTNRCLPERGRFGIFNRSYYEEVLVVRVHPEFLKNQKVPVELVNEDIWEKRFKDINAFERYLSRNGTLILKFFLYVSKEEQRKRFLKRLDEPEKNWKFSVADAAERDHWKDYMDAYEEMIAGTATKHAPWCVVPADNKWFSRLVVAEVIIDALEQLRLAFPVVEAAKQKELKEARRLLESEQA